MLLLLKIKQTPQLSYGGLYLRLCCSNDFKTDSVGLNRKIYCTFTSPDISQSAWWLVGFDPNWIQLASIKHLLGSITNKKVPFLKLSSLNGPNSLFKSVVSIWNDWNFHRPKKKFFKISPLYTVHSKRWFVESSRPARSLLAEEEKSSYPSPPDITLAYGVINHLDHLSSRR